MKNNKYQTELDFLIFSLIALGACILIFVCLYIFEQNEKYKTLGYSADGIISQAQVYDFQNNMAEGKKIYLNTLIEEEYINHVYNPFDSEMALCMEKESYVIKKDDIIYLTLRCGDYSLVNYSTNQKKKVYKTKNGEEKLIKTY